MKEPLGSAGFTELFNPLFVKLQELKRASKVGADPQRVMLVLDAFNAGEQISALSYNKYFLDFDPDDRKTIDRLLQSSGVVEPTVVFEDDRIMDLGLTPGIHYTNDDLVSEVFKPRTPMAIDLTEAAVYSLRVPNETLHELMFVPRCIRTVLARTLHIVGRDYHQDPRRGDDKDAIASYAERKTEERLLDAKTLGSLIFAYASDSYPDVQEKAKELSVNFAVLFNKPDDIQALVTLKNYITAAAEKTVSGMNVELLKQIDKAIAFRKTQQEKRQPQEEENWKRIIRESRLAAKRN